MSIFQLTQKDCLPPIYDSIKAVPTNALTNLNPDDYVIVETYRDRVLETYEQNGYDDSDFIAVIWDSVNKKPVDVTYATTRAWTYLNNAEVDADAETVAKYKAYLSACAIKSRWGIRHRMMDDAHKMRIDRFQLRRLEKAYPHKEMREAVFKLLRVKRFRSDFRNSLAQQVRKWLDNPNSTYETPLSAKQEYFLR